MSLLRQEPQGLYNAACRSFEADLPPPFTQFTEAARTEHAPDPRRQLEEHWRRELAGAALTSGLPYDRPRPATGPGVARRSATIEGVAVHTSARDELYVVVIPGPEKTALAFEYSADLFARRRLWVSHFAQIPSSAASDPATSMTSTAAIRRTVTEA
ncbi:hypothetical protein [Streptomyces prunicolor]